MCVDVRTQCVLTHENKQDLNLIGMCTPTKFVKKANDQKNLSRDWADLKKKALGRGLEHCFSTNEVGLRTQELSFGAICTKFRALDQRTVVY